MSECILRCRSGFWKFWLVCSVESNIGLVWWNQRFSHFYISPIRGASSCQLVIVWSERVVAVIIMDSIIDVATGLVRGGGEVDMERSVPA